MFRHHDIPDDHEAITFSSLFQNRKEGIAAARAAQKRQSAVARASDKVQVMSAVGPMQAAGHNKPHGTGSTVPALAKNARAGHPQFRNGKEKHGKPGHPSSGLLTTRHRNKSNSTSSTAAHPCKKRKDGAPSVGMAHTDIIKRGHRREHQL
jgi:hypothetical protein